MTINGTISTNGLGYVQANLDNIQFNKIKTNQKSTTIKKSVQSENDSSVWVANGNINNWLGSVNAVDIDWNDAKLELPESLGGTQYITSSGQLLSIIKNMADLISAEPEPEPQPTYYSCTCYVANGSGIVDGGTNTKTVSVVKNSQPQFTITPNSGYTLDGATVQNGTINGYIVTSNPVNINGFMVTVECMLAYTYSYVEPARTLQSVMWSGGSVSPTTINEGSMGTFNKGTVTAEFDNGDLENVTSSATFTQYINNVSKGTISGTKVTAPSVSADSTVTIKASYGGKTASQTVTYTAKDVPVVSQYYQGLATEDQIQNQSYINSLNYNETTKPTSTVSLQAGYNLFIFPSDWGTPELYEDSAHTFKWVPFTASDLGITNPTGKIVLVWESPDNRTTYIVW